MTTVELLAKLKKLVDDRGNKLPKITNRELENDLTEHSKEYSDALAKAIRALS